MDPSIMLGRVTMDDMEQLITKREDSEKEGVELRKGILDLQQSFATLFRDGIGSPAMS